MVCGPRARTVVVVSRLLTGRVEDVALGRELVVERLVTRAPSGFVEGRLAVDAGRDSLAGAPPDDRGAAVPALGSELVRPPADPELPDPSDDPPPRRLACAVAGIGKASVAATMAEVTKYRFLDMTPLPDAMY